jgi:hypothetical protein
LPFIAKKATPPTTASAITESTTLDDEDDFFGCSTLLGTLGSLDLDTVGVGVDLGATRSISFGSAFGEGAALGSDTGLALSTDSAGGFALGVLGLPVWGAFSSCTT